MKNLLFLVLFVSFSASAQNIVPNSNFAIRTLCPTGVSQIDRSMGWYRPTFATSDNFNGCDTSSFISVPNNVFGHQASTDNAYAGEYCFFDNGYPYREYIATAIPPCSGV